jgi:penicillin-binding protein 1C
MTLLWPLVLLVLATEVAVWLMFRRRRSSGRHWPRLTALAGALGVAPVLVLFVYVRVAPLPEAQARLSVPGAVVLDANGVVLQRDLREGLRIPVALSDVAQVVVDATIAAEDRRFREHPGIDPFAIARAIVALPSQRSGASTLTQQLARRLYVDSSTPLLLRKAEEALLALQLEARYSKDEILALYLNEVYYGNGAYGIEAAARVYFGVGARHLDLAQAAFLAGLPQQPAGFSDPSGEAASARQRYVLERMVATGRISEAEASLAVAEELALLPASSDVVAPHFVNYALDELSRLAPELDGARGLIIETTLDAGLQREAEDHVSHQLALLAGKDVSSAAVVVLEPAAGRVLAMVGSADFDDEARDGQVNVALAPRQPGSALKPFLYAAAFERGYTAASMLLDVPTSFLTETGTVYEPLNYDRRSHGPVPLRVALASSLNVPAVRTLDAIGVDAFLDMAHRVGLSTLTDSEVYGLSLTLGGGEVRLLDLTNAYAAIANGGAITLPYAIERVRDAGGRVVYQHVPAAPNRVIGADHAFLLAEILSDANARELGFGYAPALRLPFRAAVKTGTTTEFRDNWAIGFTPERAVGVWVGNADNSPMRNVSGLDGAGPIWHGVMEAAMAGLQPTWLRPPDGLTRATVCAPTGELPGTHCPAAVEEWFVAGTVPATAEDYYLRSSDGRLLFNLPAEARSWAQSAGLPLAEPEASGQGAFVVQPAAGSVLFLAGELPRQTVLLRASPPAGAERIDFLVDGELVGSVAPRDPAMAWHLETGKHVLEVRVLLAGGRVVTATSKFEVRG